MFYDVGSCTNQNTWKISMMTTIIQTQPRSGKSLATSFSSRAIKWLKLEGRRCKAWNISASCPKKTSKKTLFDSLKEIIMTNYHYLLCSWRRFSTPTEIFSDSIFRGRCDHMNLRDTLRKIHSNRPASVSIADAKSTMRRKVHTIPHTSYRCSRKLWERQAEGNPHILPTLWNIGAMRLKADGTSVILRSERRKYPGSSAHHRRHPKSFLEMLLLFYPNSLQKTSVSRPMTRHQATELLSPIQEPKSTNAMHQAAETRRHGFTRNAEPKIFALLKETYFLKGCV